jgi:hypothetical protein
MVLHAGVPAFLEPFGEEAERPLAGRIAVAGPLVVKGLLASARRPGRSSWSLAAGVETGGFSQSRPGLLREPFVEEPVGQEPEALGDLQLEVIVLAFVVSLAEKNGAGSATGDEEGNNLRIRHGFLLVSG